MGPFRLAVLLGFPLIWHIALASYVYVDAPKYGMDRRKWLTVALVIPLFGFFAYMFGRDERTREPEPDLFADGPYKIHRSRADDASLFTPQEDEDDME